MSPGGLDASDDESDSSYAYSEGSEGEPGSEESEEELPVEDPQLLCMFSRLLSLLKPKVESISIDPCARTQCLTCQHMAWNWCQFLGCRNLCVWPLKGTRQMHMKRGVLFSFFRSTQKVVGRETGEHSTCMFLRHLSLKGCATVGGLPYFWQGNLAPNRCNTQTLSPPRQTQFSFENLLGSVNLQEGKWDNQKASSS